MSLQKQDHRKHQQDLHLRHQQDFHLQNQQDLHREAFLTTADCTYLSMCVL